MMYIYINDIYNFLKKNIKYLLLYLLIVSIYVIIESFNNDGLNLTIALKGCGLILDKNNGFLDYCVFFANLFFSFFVIVKLLDNDLKNGNYNIFLRMSLKKWSVLKIFSISLVILIRFLIYCLLLLVIGKIFNILLLEFIKYIFYYFLLNLAIQLLFVIIYSFITTNYIFLIFVVLIINCFDLSNIKNNNILIFVVILESFMFVFLNNKRKNKILEMR